MRHVLFAVLFAAAVVAPACRDDTNDGAGQGDTAADAGAPASGGAATQPGRSAMPSEDDSMQGTPVPVSGADATGSDPADAIPPPEASTGSEVDDDAAQDASQPAPQRPR